MKNKYEIKGNVTKIFLDRKDGTTLETLISTSDLPKLIDHPYKWFAHWSNKTKSFYVHGYKINESGRRSTITLHRFLFDFPEKNIFVDHINHDTLDNTRENLRLVNNSENQQNRKGAQRNSKSGIRGVSWCKKSRKWHAQIKINKKVINLGYFKDIKEAERIVKKSRLKHMPFSRENKHIVFYSGGIGSWATAKRVIKTHGKENVILLFTDTLIEDEDLYRFIDETVQEMGVEYVRIKDGRTPWEVFKDVRYLGNSRLAQCSHILKQKTADNWIKANFKPDECVLYLGIDWTEEHRRKAPEKNWAPYKVEFPMCEEPFITKEEMLAELERLGIERPRLYKMGFSHNNCGGFCVRAGQGHFVNLYKKLPKLYKYHEEKEQEMRDYLGKDVSILRRTRNGERINLTLKQLREEIESDQTEQIDMFDIGGCGCFVTED